MTQTDRILQHLKKRGSITQLEAMQEYGIYRLASRISDLKKNGVKIQRIMKKGWNRYGDWTCFAEYRLVE